MLAHFETRAEKAIFVGLALVLLALAAATVGSAATQIGQTAPGFALWRNLVAPAIGTLDWPGIRAGIPQREVVVAVDGRPVADTIALRVALRAAVPGTVHGYDFRRGGRTTRVEVPSVELRWRDVLPVYLPYWVDGAAFFVVGLAVFYFRPELPAARAALALGAILGTVLILASDVFSAFWLDRLYFSCESLMPGALLHFALCFPEEKEIVRRHGWLRWAVYVPFLPLATLQSALAGGDAELHLLANDWAYTATAAAGLLSVASLAHAFLTSRSALARQQAKVVLAGVAFAAFVPSLGILAIVLLRADVPMNLLAPFYLVYPLSIGYAIARHDLFSVDRYLRLGAVYAALSLVVFLSWAGVVLGGEALLGAGRRLPSGIVPLYVLLVLVLFDPLRAAIQRGVDRLFYRQAYSYRGTVEETSRVLASVLDSERIARTVLATLTEAMAIEWAVLLAFGVEQSERRVFGDPPEKAAEAERLLPPGDPLVAAVAARARPLSRYEAQPGGRRGSGATGAGRFERFARLGTALVLPLRFESAAVGLLLVGEKKSGAFYTDQDLHLLETLGHQCALALTNARAYEIIRRTQAELVQSERLAAVGELASTVAHGIRNPLAGIRAAAQVAREEAAPDSPVGESLDDIISESDRLEARVRSILDISRPLGLDVVPGDVSSFLRGFADGLRVRFPEPVRIELELEPGLPPVAFDATRLAEALDIVAVNAVEAMAGRGTLRIGAHAERDGKLGPRVAIAIADTGPGMDAARAGRVFELFYTTKPAGTGVGLAMARRLVERQGGTIEVQSAPGEGATFTVRLPVSSPA